ncbi:HAD family phosphatase [Candidatus Saccharibacteria bacterium]|nr:HAD family phosphatase [Candidatus Saccharibacteria bacterium]
MIKAVIFDFFGVLATRGLRQYKKIYFKNDEHKIMQGKTLQRELDSGTLGYDEFIDRLADLGETSREKVLQYTENYLPNRKLLDYIRQELKPKYRIGIISNSGADWVLKIIGDDDKKLFDDIVLSYQTGSVKPEPEIYKMSAKNLGVKPAECVLVDDILIYCHGAEAAGMSAVWYKNLKQMKRQLEVLLTAGPDN